MDELRALFDQRLEDQKEEEDYGPDNCAVWVTTEEIADVVEWNERVYDLLAELSDEYLIEEDGGGFYVSRA